MFLVLAVSPERGTAALCIVPYPLRETRREHILQTFNQGNFSNFKHPNNNEFEQSTQGAKEEIIAILAGERAP